jgi:hypothetical protein
VLIVRSRTRVDEKLLAGSCIKFWWVLCTNILLLSTPEGTVLL